MNISLGMVEWEESHRPTPGTLGRKLAIAFSTLTLTALAIGHWLTTPEVSLTGEDAPTIAEVAFAAE